MKTMTTSRKRGDIVTVGTTTIQFIECDRGRVRIKIIAHQEEKIVITPKIRIAIDS